jgi:hypothetical protein
MNPYAIPTVYKLDVFLQRPQPVKIFTKLRVAIDSIELNVKAVVRTQLLTENEDFHEENVFVLEGEEYSCWKEDDFILKWAKYKLSLGESPIPSKMIVYDTSNSIVDTSYSFIDVSNLALDVSNSVFSLSSADVSGNTQ